MLIAIESPAIMPEPVVQVSARIDLHTNAPRASMAPGIRLPRTLRRAARIRQLEFLAGRSCAAQAIARLDPRLRGVLPGSFRTGAPRFPSAVTGSISHAAGFVSAAAASRRLIDALGIDAEVVAGARRSSRIASRIATRRERQAAIDRSGTDRETAVTLLFSAKESLFKALYPRVGRPFDFLDARVEASGDGLTGSLVATLLTTLSRRAGVGAVYRGRFQIRDGFVHTGIVIPAGW